MEPVTLKAEVREQSGKGPARQLRMQGQIPGVFYGPGVDTTPIALSPKELTKALSTEYGINAVINLQIEGKGEERVMAKDVQVHPVDRNPLHVDLYKVGNNRTVALRIPVKTKGRAVGVQKGGQLQVVFRDLPVRCTPDKIVPAIVIDVSQLDMYDVYKVKDLVLPEGITVEMNPERRVVLVGEARKKVVLEEEETAVVAEGAEGAAPPAEG